MKIYSFITNASGDVDQHLQYLPFGEPWIDQRTQNNIRFTFSGKERDEETGYNYFGARYYNSDISIWLSVDPMACERAWLTPYNYCSNNPIVRTDPSGALDGEYEWDKTNKVWQKVSDKGDDIGVDFYHWDGLGGKQTTYVTDRQGNWNTITDGRKYLQGEARGNNVNWETIYDEWKEGKGPERSTFEGNHPSNVAIKENYLFQNEFEKFEQSGLSKNSQVANFWYVIDNVRTGTNMQVQMMGSYNVSFYKLGDKTLSLVMDSKSRESFYYHLPVQNYDRGSRTYNIPGTYIYYDKQATTYQTYFFFK